MLVRELIDHLSKFPQDATVREIRMGRNKATEGKVVLYAAYFGVETLVEYPELGEE